MHPVVTYYGKPIQTIQYEQFKIDYVLWDKGVRLIEVNKYPHQWMSNVQFSYFMNVLLKFKSEGKLNG
jgi:hypothetical protein